MRVRIALSLLPILSVGAWPRAQGPTQEAKYVWGGETRQVFHRDVDVNGQTERRVWTVGDGPLIRYAVNPQGDDWTFQNPPSDVTQTLLDVYFLPDGDRGYACGVGGQVLVTNNKGTTWSHLGSGTVPNYQSLPATLWRVRFNKGHNEPGAVGFACGLWTFKEWSQGAWVDTQLMDGGQSVPACRFEFYAMQMIVNPGDPSQWVAVAAGQEWPSCGGAHTPGPGYVFYRTNAMSSWTHVFTTTLTDGSEIWDPWDIEFEENPSLTTNAVGYLSAGGGATNAPNEVTPTGIGAIYRTENSGLTWTLELDGDQVPLTTMYGAAVTGTGEAMAAGYGGQIWYRNSVVDAWFQKSGDGLPGFTGFTGPLGGANGTATGDVYVVGSFGFIQRSADGWTTAQNLNTPVAEFKSEQWRFEDVHFVSATKGYAVGAKKAIAVTTNSGVDFDLDIGAGVPLSEPAQSLYSIDFDSTGTKGVAVGASSGPFPPPNLCPPTVAQAFALYKNGDGATWQPACIPTLVASVPVTLRGVSWARLSNGREHVWAVGFEEVAGGAVPLILRSIDNGMTWEDADPQNLVPNGVKLMAVDFEGSVGFAVGYQEGTTPIARAYRLDAANTSNHQVVSVTGPPLRSVATNGTNTYAVGDEESVYWYVGSSFVPPFPAPPALGTVPLPLVSVAVAPLSNYVLIGAQNPSDEIFTPGVGKLLRFDGSNWGTVAAKTNKGVPAIQVRSTTSIWYLGRNLEDQISSEFGKVNDSVILKLVPVP